MRYFLTDIIMFFLCAVCMSSLVSCSGLTEKDNLPLPAPLAPLQSAIHPVRLWIVKVGCGMKGQELNSRPAIGSIAVFLTNLDGIVTAVNKNTGHILWQTQTHRMLVAGPALAKQSIIVAARKGEVIALDQQTGRILWEKKLHWEILAQPVVTPMNTAIIKTTNGYLIALEVDTGKKRWTFYQAEPNQILLRSSTPVLFGHQLIVGFSKGYLASINQATGNLRWMQALATPRGAFSVQRMIDIDADPVVGEHVVYAANYQGHLCALFAQTGRMIWSHHFSSYTGMTLDDQMLYISDAKSRIWAIDRVSGVVGWKQSQLIARKLTAPTLFKHYLVVGDAEGYVHWIRKKEGMLMARDHLPSSIVTAPVVDPITQRLYVVTSHGLLVAYSGLIGCH